MCVLTLANILLQTCESIWFAFALLFFCQFDFTKDTEPTIEILLIWSKCDFCIGWPCHSLLYLTFCWDLNDMSLTIDGIYSTQLQTNDVRQLTLSSPSQLPSSKSLIHYRTLPCSQSSMSTCRSKHIGFILIITNIDKMMTILMIMAIIVITTIIILTYPTVPCSLCSNSLPRKQNQP